MERFAILAYYIKHQEQTSRDDKDLTEITSDDLDGLAHHTEVELNWDKKNKTPDPAPVTLDETSAHKAFSNCGSCWPASVDSTTHLTGDTTTTTTSPASGRKVVPTPQSTMN